MLCDRCGQREATHHDLVVNGGQVRETHLCEECAQSQASGSGEPPATLGECLTNFVLTPPEGAMAQQASRPTSKPARCDGCGLTFAELKKTGLVGCERCYMVFEDRLTPLLQRAHEGGARHTGKSPKRQGEVSRRGVPAADEGDDPRTIVERIEALKAELAEAVKIEAYERAAEIRDQLDKLSEDERGGLA